MTKLTSLSARRHGIHVCPAPHSKRLHFSLVSDYVSSSLSVPLPPPPHERFSFLFFSFKGQRDEYVCTRSTMSTLIAQRGIRALAQRIPRVSLTRAAITKISLSIPTPPPRHRSRGSRGPAARCWYVRNPSVRDAHVSGKKARIHPRRRALPLPTS